MSKKYMQKCILGALLSCGAFGIVFANNAKVPTCQEAVFYMPEESESGDCLYDYKQVKMLSVDKASGVVTCQAIRVVGCPYNAEGNEETTIKFTAKYGIVTQEIYEDSGY